MKKFIAMLCLIFFANSAFAMPNYSYSRVEDEYYDASSPTGYFEQYNPSQNYPKHTVYVHNDGYHNVSYAPDVVFESAPVSMQNIQTPQSYHKRRVVEENMRDNRETADKVIDRAGRVAGTLGFLGLVTMGIIGIAHAL